MRINRRTFLAMGTALAGRTLMAGPAARDQTALSVQALTQAVTEEAAPAAATAMAVPAAARLDALAARTVALRTAFTNGSAGATVELDWHSAVLAQRFATARPADRARAGRLAADAAILNAHAQIAAARYALGSWWADQAQEIAEEAGDGELAGLAACRRATAALRTGRPPEEVAAFLREQLRRRPGPWTTGYLEIHLAGAYARAGRGYEALSAADRAEVALDKAAADGSPRPDWVPLQPEGWLAHHRGATLVLLRRGDHAEPFLRHNLALLPPSLVRARGSGLVLLADAVAQRGAYDEAAAVAVEAWRIAAAARVTHDLRRLGHLHARLHARGAGPHLRQLDEVIAAAS